MEELDLLKKDWKKKEHSFSQLGEKEIYGMLHRRSSSIVKWILIISIMEVVLWTVIGTVYTTDDFVASLHHREVAIFLKATNWLNYAVVLFFIYLFYRNYVNISATSSTRKLMTDILRTRKTVRYYVWYNLLMIALSMISAFYMAFCYSPSASVLRAKIHDGKYMLMTIGILLFAVVLCVAVFWLFYRLLYGILLRKLLANYRELKKIDS